MSVIEAQWKDKLQLIHMNRIWIFGVAFLAARVEIAEMYPFAIAVYLAAYLADCGSWGVYGIVLLGICSTWSVFSAIQYGAMMLLITIGIILIKGHSKEDQRLGREFYPLYTACFAGIMVGLYGIMYRVIANDLGDWYMAVLEGVLTTCFTLMLRQAYLTINTGKDYQRSESIVGILVLLSVCLAGVPSSHEYYLNPLMLVSCCALLILAYRNGFVYGISTGIVCGIVLAIRFQNVAWLAIGVIVGMTISFFRDWNRLLTVMGYLAVIGLLGFLYLPELLEPEMIRSIVLAGMVYLLTPRRYIDKHESLDTQGGTVKVQERMNQVFQDRVHSYAKVFRKMGSSFDGLPLVSVEAPQYARQLQEIGSSLQEFSEASSSIVTLDQAQQSAIIKQFAKEHVQIRELVMIQGIYGRKELYLSARTIRGRVMTTKEAARLISEILGDAYRVSNSSRLIINRDYDVIVFEEEIRYRYLMGARRHIKDGQQVSGDQFSQMELSGGQVLMMLADGMGCGEQASEQSEQLVDLLEDMLDAGFRKETAIRLVNELLTAKSGGETFATLDLCMVDLYTGVVEFLKMGASITLIRRGKWVETIQSTSLPVGVQEETEMDGIQKKLYHGDMIIMVSDGLLDGIPSEDKEGTLQEMVLSIHTRNPQELADELMVRVEALNAEGMRDDASVLVLGLWKK